MLPKFFYFIIYKFVAVLAFKCVHMYQFLCIYLYAEKSYGYSSKYLVVSFSNVPRSNITKNVQKLIIKITVHQFKSKQIITQCVQNVRHQLQHRLKVWWNLGPPFWSSSASTYPRLTAAHRCLRLQLIPVLAIQHSSTNTVLKAFCATNCY